MNTTETFRKLEVLMPDSWDPEQYTERAKAWRDKAASLPEGRERDACVTVAEGYERLAEVIEAQRSRRGASEGSKLPVVESL